MHVSEKAWQMLWRSGIRPPELTNYFRPSRFFTWHSRPKVPSIFPSVPLGEVEIKDQLINFGIVVQGPIRKRHDFTFRTLEFYRRTFPSALIALSTWEGELSERERMLFQQLDLIVLENERPKNTGPGNINLQIQSTRSAIEHLDSRHCTHLLKSRTDQRIYNPRALESLLSMQGFFPIDDSRGRLFATSLDSFQNRIFGLSDMVQFGTTAALRAFWEVSLVGDEILPNWEKMGMMVESYLAYSYAQTHAEFEFTDRGWLAALQTVFGIVDASSLDLLWPKYSRREYLWRRYEESDNIELDFFTWLKILSLPRH